MVHSLVTSPRIAGLREHHGQTFPAAWEAIITLSSGRWCSPGSPSGTVAEPGADLGEFSDLERRRLEVRGRSEPIDVRVLRVGVPARGAAA